MINLNNKTMSKQQETVQVSITITMGKPNAKQPITGFQSTYQVPTDRFTDPMSLEEQASNMKNVLLNCYLSYEKKK
jgi:hypothetical protein